MGDAAMSIANVASDLSPAKLGQPSTQDAQAGD